MGKVNPGTSHFQNNPDILTFVHNPGLCSSKIPLNDKISPQLFILCVEDFSYLPGPGIMSEMSLSLSNCKNIN